MFTRRLLRTKAMQHLYAFYQRQRSFTDWNARSEEARLRAAFANDILCLQEACCFVIRGLLFLAGLDEEREGKSVKHHTLNNYSVIKQLRQHGWCKKQATDSFHVHRKCIAQFYEEHVHACLANYKPSPSMEIRIIQDLCCKLLKDKNIERGVANLFLDWSLYEKTFQTLMLRCIKRYALHQSDIFPIHAEAAFFEEKQFYVNLVTMVIKEEVFCEGVFLKAILHWQKTRIFLVDRILLQMAVAEVFLLQTIPPSIAINEYIEIAKIYSTPQSARFLHGVLDKVFQANKITTF